MVEKEESMVRRRWIIYLAIGTVFGAIDFFYLEFLNRFPGDQFLFISGPTGWMLKFLVLNLGLWLVPVVPVALYEARLRRAPRR